MTLLHVIWDSVPVRILLLVLVIMVLYLIRLSTILSCRQGVLDQEPVDRGLKLHAQLPSYDAMILHPRYWHLWTVRQWLTWLGESKDNRL